MNKIQKEMVLDKHKDEALKIICRTCHVDTNHKVLQSTDLETLTTELRYERDGNLKEGYKLFENESWQVIQCSGCESISFRKTAENSEEMDQDNEPWIRVELFPKYVAGVKKLSFNDYTVPVEVQGIYEETFTALCNGQAILAGIGIRAIVETVCKDKNTPGRNLKEKIDSLVALKVLTEEHSKFLHGLRNMGNDAAHEVKPLRIPQLKLAFEIIEHLLKGVYILPAKAVNLPQR